MDSVSKCGAPDVYNAFVRNCPSHTVLAVLANKWVMLMIAALRKGPMRFGELQRRLDGISPKMLSQTLRTLERDGFVERHVQPTIPPQVSYSLLPLGEELAGLMDAILTWSQERVPSILKARASYVLEDA